MARTAGRQLRARRLDFLRRVVLPLAVRLGLTSAMWAVLCPVAKPFRELGSADRAGSHSTMLALSGSRRERSQKSQRSLRRMMLFPFGQKQPCRRHPCYRFLRLVSRHRSRDIGDSRDGTSRYVLCGEVGRCAHRDTDVSNVTLESAPMLTQETDRYGWIELPVTDKIDPESKEA